MERRKNQQGAGPDIEFTIDDSSAEARKKESKLFHFSAVACFLVLVCLVFFSSSASGPLREQYGLGKEETIVSRYEVDVDTSSKDFQPIPGKNVNVVTTKDQVVQSPPKVAPVKAAEVNIEQKFSVAQMVEQNTRCQVKSP
jgi:hypothetical protein